MLTGSATLVRSTLWNLAGRVLPLIVAVVATPFLVGALGLARWGIFALALSLVGLFGVFDLGIGRALTRLVAARIAGPDRAGSAAGSAAAAAVMTGLALLAGLGGWQGWPPRLAHGAMPVCSICRRRCATRSGGRCWCWRWPRRWCW